MRLSCATQEPFQIQTSWSSSQRGAAAPWLQLISPWAAPPACCEVGHHGTGWHHVSEEERHGGTEPAGWRSATGAFHRGAQVPIPVQLPELGLARLQDLWLDTYFMEADSNPGLPVGQH